MKVVYTNSYHLSTEVMIERTLAIDPKGGVRLIHNIDEAIRHFEASLTPDKHCASPHQRLLHYFGVQYFEFCWHDYRILYRIDKNKETANAILFMEKNQSSRQLLEHYMLRK
ncbi:hypothetical protein GCM10023116_21080 [Kistimonas scapharcae]|uniref:Type II toxin-antitoxin system RelE/ParE family toxin n=1 Tax=Kistimonas scapharcae TaxID=1036133 RepID=A0ABP8V1S1_9GAMM